MSDDAVHMPTDWLRVRCALEQCDKETMWQFKPQRDMMGLAPVLVLPTGWVEYVTYVDGERQCSYWCGYRHLRDFLRTRGDDGE